MLVPNPDLPQAKAFTDQEALEWLQARHLVSLSDAELAELWGWNEAKVKRKLQAWTNDGRLFRAFSSLGELRLATDPAELTKAEQNEGAPVEPQEVATPEPDIETAALPVPEQVQSAVAAPMSSGNAAVARQNVSHRVIAYLTAIALASAAAYFSIGGLVELFPAQQTAVAVLGVILEIAKLVMVAWLTAHWRLVGWWLRAVMVVLVIGLVTVNAGGTFARLIQSHFLLNEAASTGVDERLGVLDAKIAEQGRRVAGIEGQEHEISDVIAKMTALGRTKTALTAVAEQQARREGISKTRQGVADNLVELKNQRSHLEAEGKRVFAETGSARFLATQLGTDAETVIRWLVMCLVLLIDPSAVVLTIAATMRHED
jgi:hypothetical protein